jgi:hypothetical protein
MEVHFAPELQAEIDQLVVETGLAPDKLVEDAMAGYVAELVETREMLNRRYDDLKTGKVTPISRDEVIAHFREKSAAGRRPLHDRVLSSGRRAGPGGPARTRGSALQRYTALTVVVGGC